MERNDEIIEAVKMIVKNEELEIDISEILYQHKCFYLLSQMTGKKNKNEFKVSAVNDLAYNKLLISVRYKTCAPVFNSIKSFPYAVIKGAVLSQSIYGNTLYRKSGDIDLLICRDNVNNVNAVMHENGFIQGRIIDDEIVPFNRQEKIFYTSLSHQTAPFIKKTNNKLCPFVEVDINLDVSWGESKAKADTSYILSETEIINICGVELYKLKPIMEFISLCLHHYKDINSIYLLSKGSLKLYLFCDIYYYLINNNIEITELKRECDNLNIIEYVYYCVYYTNMIFNDVKLNDYICALENEKGKNILDTFGFEWEKRHWGIPFFKRLFSDDFYLHFNDLLNDKDLEKIQKNNSFMI